jgi:hypothetical protein
VAIFPDTLEKVFGVGYGFKGTWNVSRGLFEALTLGTLAVIVVFGAIGFLAGAGVRREVVAVEGDRPEPTVLPPDLPPAP